MAVLRRIRIDFQAAFIIALPRYMASEWGTQQTFGDKNTPKAEKPANELSSFIKNIPAIEKAISQAETTPNKTQKLSIKLEDISGAGSIACAAKHQVIGEDISK